MSETPIYDELELTFRQKFAEESSEDVLTEAAEPLDLDHKPEPTT